ncbi:MAG: UDP-N-acetylmuramoyl-L-alanyl-D-glutamate--2,6-diaminopimelate ligase [Proteobacteria bacterium]|nr:UDP-N-acetylmuramoyl-L-alanyl-D-glutamate--2,6-diaminopimelate ligase [Pseudomonadota bacterium]
MLRQLDLVELHGDIERDVLAITRDSRQVRRGSVFVAISGVHLDGHSFVPQLQRATAVVVERQVQAPPGVTVIRVERTKLALARLAAAFNAHPSRAMQMVGVTGTNGKTTITTIVDEALRHVGWRSGRIGTTGSYIGGQPRQTDLTTPGAVELQALLAEMRDDGVSVVAMEVSSIGLAQNRVDGIEYALGVFTNLSRDHLDFHASMAEYGRAKARMFEELLRPIGGAPRALMCADDDTWAQMGSPEDRWLYGFAAEADIRIEECRLGSKGVKMKMGTPFGPARIHSPIIGRHNASNLAAGLGVCLAMGMDLEDATDALSSVSGVSGRLEVIPHDALLVVVDYAHTEDALTSAISSVRQTVSGEVWVVFGCGGGRDQGKRPRMGRAVEAAADHAVVTSDNPRNEDPQQIVDDILAGMDLGPSHVDTNRADAIRWALNKAKDGDAVIIAGKGHEKTQQVGSELIPFDDCVVARLALEER